MDLSVLTGDVIRTRKPHPCGGDEWTVTRTGADIKIRCNRCGRVVMMDRSCFTVPIRLLPVPDADPKLANALWSMI